MQRHDAIVVGGGPSGAACAARLVEAGVRTLVLDRERFPRTKLCAGWITPEVVADLDMDVARYPYRLNTFDGIQVHLKGFDFTLDSRQHSIRRFEFDRWLLERSGAPVAVHTVRHIERDGSEFVIDGHYRCEWLVGAGGTRCPVYRELFRERNPRARLLQAATYEHEFPYEWQDPRCHLWFFDKGLPGYSWYVPKADGYLNCGIGAMAERLKRRGDDIKGHWQRFTAALDHQGLVRGFEFAPKGYSYYLRGGVHCVSHERAFITGDAVGLATRDLCEGIGPAIRSGQRAAAAIVEGKPYTLEGIGAYSAERGWVRGLLEYGFLGTFGGFARAA